jgi:hypothetical protein
MKALLKLFYFVLFLVTVALLAGLFLPDHTYVGNKVRVRANSTLVYQQLADVESWIQWAPWFMNDSIADFETGNITVGKGATLKWKSEEYGNGSLELTRCYQDSLVEGKVDLGQSGQVSFKLKLLKKNENNSTLLNAEFLYGTIGYFERYFVFLLQKKLEEQFKNSFNRVKEIAEDLMYSRHSDPEVTGTNKMDLMVYIDTVASATMYDSYKKNLGYVRAYLQRRKIPAIDTALAIVLSSDKDGQLILASGYPIPKKTWGWKNYRCIRIDSCGVTTLIHRGDYSRSEGHAAIRNYLKENKLKADTFYWEKYRVTPETNEDTSAWCRQIYFPIKP